MTNRHAVTVRSICMLYGLFAVYIPHAFANDSPKYVVSMVDLIVRGDQFVDHRVEVFGYLASTGGLHLYLTKDHANAMDTASSILVSDTDNGDIHNSSCMSSYVTVSGVLVELEPGIVGLVSVESIFQQSSQDFCLQHK